MALKDNQSRTIVIEISEKEYPLFIQDIPYAHTIIQQRYTTHPESFPSSMSKGYKLNGRTRKSKKLDMRMRRIEIQGITYRLRPSFVLSYMRGKTQDVQHPLFLVRFGVPFWALALVFGRNAMYWYRTFISLSSFSLVGTTVHKPASLPEDLLADEFHIRLKGQKAYIATTIAKDCFLGAQASAAADEKHLTQAYGVFKQEALNLNPDYQPQTVNTDGWMATQNTWKALFTIVVIECFLHAFIKIRDRATKKVKASFDQAADKVWNIFRAVSKRHMSQQIRRLAEWTRKNILECPMKENLLKLCKKKDRWLKHFDYPNAYRTSAKLDRIMKKMERHAINSQMFHATIETTSKNFRAFALIHNFSPSCPAVIKQNPDLKSPAARLNGFVYHDDWLHNLLIAASLNGFR